MGKILIVVDMQNDFITGPLGTSQAQAIVPKVVEKIKNEIAQGTKIHYTLDTHNEDYLNTQEGRNLPVKHCIEDTEGHELIREVSEALDLILYGPNPPTETKKGTFGSTLLGQYLSGEFVRDKSIKLEPIDEIELVGLCTDVCVISNAMLLKAFLPETLIKVDASCCAGVTPESHERALKAMEACQIRVIR